MKRHRLDDLVRLLAEKEIQANAASLVFAGQDDGRTVNGKSPWAPSLTATARVKDYLAPQDVCPFCGGDVRCVHHDQVYGREYGDWPWMLACSNCEASVGLHPFTNIPLGKLGDKATRQSRMRAKNAFNPLWQGGRMTRTSAYTWLAALMEVPVGQCHIGWFNAEQCERVEQLCKQRRYELGAAIAKATRAST